MDLPLLLRADVSAPASPGTGTMRVRRNIGAGGGVLRRITQRSVCFPAPDGGSPA